VEGLEPPTLGLEIRCSIHLSYTPTILSKYYHTVMCRKHGNASWGGVGEAVVDGEGGAGGR
jgi:hypothetical protein